MKSFKFLSIFVLFSIFVSCSVPKTSTKTYSKSLIVNKTYLGNWGSKYYAVQFIDGIGNIFNIRQSSGDTQTQALNALTQAEQWQGDLDASTGDITLYQMQGTTMLVDGTKYRVRSENEVDKMQPSLDSNSHVVHSFEGTMKLYKKN